MAKSRADFLREMGITTDDVVDPIAKPTKYPSRVLSEEHEASAPTASSTYKPTASSSSSQGRAYGGGTSTSSSSTGYAQPQKSTSSSSYEPSYSSSTTKLPPASSGSGSNAAARAEFLRSLGLGSNDMAHPDEVVSTSPIRGGGSSQHAKENNLPPSAAFSTSKAARTKAMVQRAHEDDDDDDRAYEMPSSQQQRAGPTTTSSQRNSTTSNYYVPPAQASSSSSSYPTSSSTHATASSTSGGGGGVYSGVNLNDPKSLKGLKPSPHLETDIPADASAEDIKNMGNQAFEVGDFRKAVRMYSRAIEKDQRNAALYSNRSAAYLQGSKQMGLDTRSMALRDADKAIELKPQWFKGYSRRGDALFKLERWAEAVEAYESALRIDPTNTSVQFSLRECQQMLPQAKSAASWSQPRELSYAQGPVPLSSSTKGTTTKSAHELLEELRRDAERTGTLLGHDYRDEALQRFRSTNSKTSTASQEYGGAGGADGSFKSEEYEKMTKPQLDRNNISEEFSSSAAAAYQRSLLDAYRKKKQGGR